MDERRPGTLLLACMLLAPCASAEPADARAVLAGLIGHTKAELVQRFGPPADTSTTIDGERLFYETLDAGRVGGRSGQDTRAGGRGDFGAARSYAFRCRTEIVIRNGRVQAFDRHGNDCK